MGQSSLLVAPTIALASGRMNANRARVQRRALLFDHLLTPGFDAVGPPARRVIDVGCHP